MLGNVYIISLYYREGFFPCFQILCCIQKKSFTSNFKTAGKKRFFMRIASAKSRSARGASHQPADIDSCLNINHTHLP